MEIGEWLSGQWFEGLQTAGIVVGMFATAYSIYDNVRSRRVEHLFRITREHRDIWSQPFQRPELNRVLDPGADLTVRPITNEERRFTQFLILHLSSVHRARRAGLMIELEGLSADVRQFFTRPIPARVWEETRRFQKKDFVRFVEACLSGE